MTLSSEEEIHDHFSDPNIAKLSIDNLEKSGFMPDNREAAAAIRNALRFCYFEGLAHCDNYQNIVTRQMDRVMKNQAPLLQAVIKLQEKQNATEDKR